MIIKTISHTSTKQSRMQALVDYIYDHQKIQSTHKQKKPVIIKQFLRGYDKSNYGKQFKANDDKRNYNYGKKRTTLRHEILSFHEDSAPYLTQETLKTIATAYLKQRCPKSLATAVVHYDGQPHIHIAFSAVDILGNPTRVSQQSFAQFKQNFQQYQQEHFPELSHSIVKHGKKKSYPLNSPKRKNR